MMLSDLISAPSVAIDERLDHGITSTTGLYWLKLMASCIPGHGGGAGIAGPDTSQDVPGRFQRASAPWLHPSPEHGSTLTHLLQKRN